MGIVPWVVAAQAGQAVVGAGAEYLKTKAAADLAKAAMTIPPPPEPSEPEAEASPPPVGEEASAPETAYAEEESPWFLSPVVLIGAAAAAYFLFLRK